MAHTAFVIDQHGALFIAHRDGCDCPADTDGSQHGEADHPVAALRALLKKSPHWIGADA